MRLERQDQIGILIIDTDRNNAINEDFIREAHEIMDEAEHDPGIQALVVTSTHKSLFCPGVDLPSMMDNSPQEMRAFFEALTGIVRRKFAYPKAEVYALNGHTIAGGCMMALAGDYRLMAKGRSIAERILFGGQNYTPEKALELNLIDEVVESEMLMDRAIEHAQLLGSKPPTGYRRLKRFSRQAVVEQMKSLDAAHLDEYVEQWFDEETQQRLAATVQRMTKPR